MKPLVPLVGVCTYIASVKIWEQRNLRLARSSAKTNISGKIASPNSGINLKPFIIAHNLILAAYSIWTFVSYFPAVIQAISDHGLKDGFCDSSRVLWDGALLEHGFIFYLSKYYEFIDTAIILAKGRPAGRLQTFHHAGAVSIMWLGNYIQSPYLSFFVFENSLIHSLMYTYYTLTAMGIKPPGKKMLTGLQIAQFYIALSAGIIYAVLPACQNNAQRLFTYLFIGYIVELIRLFTEFARKTYGKLPAAVIKKQN
ncbi:fatty acid elongase [Coemansia reversa NRRL 1564]|uniref:Elongation of fatty acids protein n=1 Tax=Coemansia reversa (strain ATCC 12441 / NRRL 1564) TaxID=763665 RepID=A0A2G5BF10_COERN|nr:fatty acid elongase [Coemansia reversa NRRL 1564]|eukprot:PIA17599.1 fatty acid elongase [Coemansia reversa NRRL 1564]